MRISLNRILQLLNLVVLIIIWTLFNRFGGNYYINATTVLLSTLLSIQTHLFLIYANKKNNQLLLILCFILIINYIARIASLLYTYYSVVFLRFTVDYTDSNYALLFILISNIFLFLGIHISSKMNKITDLNTKNKNIAIKGSKLILLLLFVYLLRFSDLMNLDSIARLGRYLQIFFFNPQLIIFSSIVYFVYSYNHLILRTKIIIISLYILFIILITLSGSRSGILTIVVYFMIANIVVSKKPSYKFNNILVLLSLVPFAIIFFFISTYLRTSLSTNLNYSDKIEIASSFDVGRNLNDKAVYSLIFDRIGFFDYTTEIIAHKQQYKAIFTPKYYLKSIIDNILTPGFNIFDTPKVSNALIYKYSNSGQATLDNVVVNYHSDQITIYGEYYSLFGGWFSLIIFFITGYFSQKVYSKSKKLSIHGLVLKNAFVLLIFYTLINSFGIDWLIFDLISIFVTYIIFKKLFFKNESTFLVLNSNN